MSFEEGLKITVDWYKRFGERWWGDITMVLTPFPVVAGKKIVGEGEVKDAELEGVVNAPAAVPESPKKRKLEETNGNGKGVVVNGGGVPMEA